MALLVGRRVARTARLFPFSEVPPRLRAEPVRNIWMLLRVRWCLLSKLGSSLVGMGDCNCAGDRRAR